MGNVRHVTEGWVDRAKCRNDPTVTLDFFFPEKGCPDGQIRIYCQPCPVRMDCLHDNLHVRVGWFGGMPPKQRRHYARKAKP